MAEAESKRAAEDAIVNGAAKTLSGISDTMKSINATREKIEESMNYSRDLEAKWSEFQRKFDELLKHNIESIAGGMGISVPVARKDLSEEVIKERQNVLGGKCTLEEVAARLTSKQYKKIVVFVGAGASVAAGIPDFRSKETGLYSTLDLDALGLATPEDLFSINFFSKNPMPFFHRSASMWPGKYRPTLTHYFLKLLDKKGMLQRVWTQNIDTLERISGLPVDKIVECHGSYATASCTSCHLSVDVKEVEKCVMSLPVTIPLCAVCGGIVKPDITFFGEDLPKRFGELKGDDMKSADLAIVIGTSLLVAPFARLPDEVGELVPRILINREKVGSFCFPGDDPENAWKAYRDVPALGDCDTSVRNLCRLCGWEDALDAIFFEGEGKYHVDKPPSKLVEPVPLPIKDEAFVPGAVMGGKPLRKVSSVSADKKGTSHVVVGLRTKVMSARGSAVPPARVAGKVK